MIRSQYKNRLSVIVPFTILGVFLLITAAPSHAGISYCGPVSFNYTRSLKWEMDNTDKQGGNHKQIKDESKVFDGEFYVCLSGTMTGNTGIFDGESMQQDITFTAKDDWLDRRTHPNGIAGRKENNMSLPEGQKRGMRGTLSLDCPEGRKVPGKRCAYNLNLFFTTAYVYQTNQETFASGNRKPEKFTLAVPQIFNRQITHEERSLPDTWSVEGSISKDIKQEKNFDECEAINRRPHVTSCSHVENETASWSLHRVRGPCDAYISRFKGDAKINGQPVSGIVNVAGGDVITTGHKSKVQITVGRGDNYYIGSNTEMKMVNPCEVYGETGKKIFMRIILGTATAKIENLLGVERDFRIATGTAVVGVRGEISKPDRGIMAFLNNFFPRIGEVMAATLPDDLPTLGTRVADIIFSVETIPKEKVTVEVFKGSVLIKDNKGSRQLRVREDQIVTSWEDGTPFEDVTITLAKD